MTTQVKCIHTEELENAMERMVAERLDLEAAKLELKADKMQWKLTKKGSFPIFECKKELETVKVKLEAERVQLDNDRTILRLTQIKLEAAQSQMEVAKLELEEARCELENARNQLEAATTQTDINNMRLEVAKKSLEAAKVRFNIATKELNHAKSKLEDAKIQLEVITAGAKGKCSGLEEENGQLQSEILTLQKTVSKMENGKVQLEVDMKESGTKINRLRTDKSVLLNDKQKLEDELKETRARLELVESRNKKPEVKICRPGNPKVFFEISIHGVSAGRIVMELYTDTTYRKAEIFRSLCTGEKGVSSNGKPLHYKGTSITYSNRDYGIGGGELTRGNYDEADSIYGGVIPGEESIGKYSGPGDLAMLPGLLSNSSCSFVISTISNSTLGQARDSVLIGRVIEGMDVVYAITDLSPSDRHLPTGTVVIVNSGKFYH